MVNKERLPHIITAVSFVVFIVLGLACATSSDIPAPPPPSGPQLDGEIPAEAGISLVERLNWLQNNAQNNTKYTLEINADEIITQQQFLFRDRNNITIILKGIGANHILSLSNTVTNSMFTVVVSNTLILENITLRGHSSTTEALIVVPGKLIMNSGATITGNDACGVEVYTLGKMIGKFEMNSGATITGNNSPGVTVRGAFIMNGGTISNNTVTRGNGGGVCVIPGGSFTMNDGNITGNTALGTDRNNLSEGRGGGVYVMTASVFDMNGGTISENRASFESGGVYMLGGGRRPAGTISGNTP